MTERDDGRIDLTALGRSNPAQADSVVGAAMSRIRARTPEREPLLADLAGWWRPGLAAAAAIVLCTLGIVLARQRAGSGNAPPASVEARVLDWAESGYVPSNGELLTAFQGYSR